LDTKTRFLSGFCQVYTQNYQFRFNIRFILNKIARTGCHVALQGLQTQVKIVA